MMSPGMGQFLLWAFAALAPNPVVSRHLAVLSAGEMVRFRQGGTRYHVAQEQGDKSVEGADGCPAIALDNSRLWLHPQVDEETVRSGAWTTKDGGVLVKYTLDLFAYSYETMYAKRCTSTMNSLPSLLRGLISMKFVFPRML